MNTPYRRGRSLWVATLLLILGHPGLAQTHIIVQESDYTDWQALAAQPGSIWETMRDNAIYVSNTLSYDTGIAGFGAKNYRLRDVASANALAYILDTPNRSTYLQRIRSNLLTGLQDITSQPYSSEWEYHVPQGGMLVDAVLALDVIRYNPGLSTQDRSSIESMLESAVNRIRTDVWGPNGQSVRSLWALYEGNTSSFLSWKNSHDSQLDNLFTPGGVFKAGNNYAQARMSSVYAQAKSMYQDILEIQGYNEYYSDPTLQAGMEYIYGYSHSPFGRCIVFGDSADDGILYEYKWNGLVDTPPTVRAHRFSDAAGRYASWQTNQWSHTPEPRDPTGRFLNFATMTEPLSSEREVAPSRIFDSYAGFIEDRQSSEALYGGLLSLTESEAHSHKEANAIALGGYGEHMLRNAGYNGWGNGTGLASWTWINNTAESGNTVVINNKDHSSKTGGGIVKGFVGGALEFARGDSGNALSNGEHLRDMIFVQPGNGAEGYWLVADHVTPDQAGHSVTAFWHPNATTLQVQSANQKYVSDITTSTRNYSTNAVELTTFLATPPTSTQIKLTTLANRGDSFNAQYLAATYSTSTGSADTMTVFFPSDQDHDVGTLARVSYGLYKGARITQGSVVDTALSSNGNGTGTLSGYSFKGEDVVYRTVANDLEWYFVGEGTFFNDGAAARTGFQSLTDISIFLDGTQGSVSTFGTNVTIYQPGLDSVLLDGYPAYPQGQGVGWFTLFVPAGTHDIALQLLEPTADFDGDGNVDVRDLLLWQRGFGMTSGATIADGDSDYDGDVDEVDLATWKSSFGTLMNTAQAVPEPLGLTMCVVALLFVCVPRRPTRNAQRVAGRSTS